MNKNWQDEIPTWAPNGTKVRHKNGKTMYVQSTMCSYNQGKGKVFVSLAEEYKTYPGIYEDNETLQAAILDIESRCTNIPVEEFKRNWKQVIG